jgi:hypothetical protein
MTVDIAERVSRPPRRREKRNSAPVRDLPTFRLLRTATPFDGAYQSWNLARFMRAFANRAQIARP